MRCFAKLNIFLKIVGFRGNYHELSSRFVLFEELFDDLTFVPRSGEGLVLDDPFCDNIVVKAYNKLAEFAAQNGFLERLEAFFATHQVALVKRIPHGAGLGGGSSDAAGFLQLCNEVLDLGLSSSQLADIGVKVGADVPFFLSGFKSANVGGIGEILTPFEDDLPPLKLLLTGEIFPTPVVFSEFRRDFCAAFATPQAQNAKFGFNKTLAARLLRLTSRQILSEFEAAALNDLAAPCERLFEGFVLQKGEFLSGSGSSKFCVK